MDILLPFLSIWLYICYHMLCYYYLSYCNPCQLLRLVDPYQPNLSILCCWYPAAHHDWHAWLRSVFLIDFGFYLNDINNGKLPGGGYEALSYYSLTSISHVVLRCFPFDLSGSFSYSLLSHSSSLIFASVTLFHKAIHSLFFQSS